MTWAKSEKHCMRELGCLCERLRLGISSSKVSKLCWYAAAAAALLPAQHILHTDDISLLGWLISLVEVVEAVGPNLLACSLCLVD